MNTNNTSLAEYMDCPETDEEFVDVVNAFSFWVEGVSQTTIAILGIIGNLVASVILSRKEMRNAFNLLLVTMACFDSTYLFGSILESFRKEFHLATNLHIILFPYLLYPFNQIAFTASIFMTVAIALERFFAVHFPLNYSQAMHEANALTKRIVKYVASVTILAVIFTATRFFEAQVVYLHKTDPYTNETIGYDVALEPTALRTAPIYTAYFNWSRLLVLGIIPFVMLVYLNAKIYKDIKARKNRRLNPRHQKQKKKFRVPRLSSKRLETVVVETNGANNNPSTCGAAATSTFIANPTLANEETIELTEAAKLQKVSNGNKTKSVTVNESRRKKEDNLAVIFMGFIMVFLICHLPRLLMNIHELITIRHAMDCQAAGLNPFPMWSGIAINLSHLLLVLNSSTNILIYCCLSSKFREECKKVFRKI